MRARPIGALGRVDNTGVRITVRFYLSVEVPELALGQAAHMTAKAPEVVGGCHPAKPVKRAPPARRPLPVSDRSCSCSDQPSPRTAQGEEWAEGYAPSAPLPPGHRRWDDTVRTLAPAHPVFRIWEPFNSPPPRAPNDCPEPRPVPATGRLRKGPIEPTAQLARRWSGSGLAR